MLDCFTNTRVAEELEIVFIAELDKARKINDFGKVAEFAFALSKFPDFYLYGVEDVNVYLREAGVLGQPLEIANRAVVLAA